jgi:hypothetical protein
MPIPLLRSHLAALPRLEAEESLLEAERIAVGSATLKPAPRGEVLAAWRDQAGVKVVRRPRDRAAHGAQLAAAGIGIRVVPKAD